MAANLVVNFMADLPTPIAQPKSLTVFPDQDESALHTPPKWERAVAVTREPARRSRLPGRSGAELFPRNGHAGESAVIRCADGGVAVEQIGAVAQDLGAARP